MSVGNVPALLELGLQGLLGVLLDIEIDGQLDVAPGNRVDVLVDQLVDDATRGVDLEHLFAPRAVQRDLPSRVRHHNAPTSSLVL